MDDPTTPKKQVQSTPVAQQLTPPTTVARRKPQVPTTTRNENSASTSCERRVGEPHDTQVSSRSARVQHGQEQPQQEAEKTLPDTQLGQDKPEAQNQHPMAMRPLDKKKRELDTNDQAEGDIAQWLSSSTSPEQRRRRFNSFLHGLWPSNDEFNAARHPFYDPEEDGLYEDFIKYEEWDGHCPFDDDDYNPFTDPTRSTEVWQPKVGDEGIEDEYDLRMVLKARREHRARSEALRLYRRQGNQLMSTDRVGSEITRALLAESDDSDSNSEPDPNSGVESGSDGGGGVDIKGSGPAIKTEESSAITNLSLIGDSATEPTTPAKRIIVFGDQKPTGGRGRPRGSKDRRKRRRSTKKKQAQRHSPDGTYKYNSDSEDEKPIRKRGKRGRNEASTDDLPWKAQTRAATRRAGYTGTDGSCDTDIDGFTSSSEENNFDERSEGEPEKKSLLSRFISFATH
ncbi:hypothetical protein EKO27_g527 [Xylaria grammica]|uniref:Uncharacterized protein n=1 Tax=Xylaria grammica TaxID=363999 RepID=A0A439DJN4_9PEZI|nr:hypothetical protein EKO27_g527 [Xylaria grammica]